MRFLCIACLLAGIGSANAELLGRYNFDDAGSPLADSSGKGNDLTIGGGTNPVWGATTGFGDSGAYDFSGDRLIAPINVNPVAMPRMTWGAWVRTDSLSSGLRKAIGHDNGGWDRTLGLDNRNPNGGFRYTAFTGNSAVNNSGPVEGTPAPTNTTDWTFIAASHDEPAKTVTFYIDLDASTIGDALVSVTEPAGFGGGWNTFAIGGIRPDNANEAWDGAIDQVFVYDEALNAAEVTAIRDSGLIVLAPTIRSFTAMPGFIDSGQSTTLSWDTEGADAVSIDMGAPAIGGDSGSVHVSPGATTTYTLTATNASGSVTAEVTVGVDVVVQPPEITEFMASNSSALDDGDGNSPDWIEVHNPNPFAINLMGYGLQDSAETWVFPDLQIGEGARVIVFASGQATANYVDAGGFFHTTFRLSAAGEDLRLIDTDGQTVLFEFTGLPAQEPDVSWGIDSNTGGQGFFLPATPGMANGSALGGFVEDTKFDIGRGFYANPVTVNVTSATPDASIAYTTDGSPPSPTNGTVVTPPAGQTPSAPVLIATTTTLRAMAFRAGWVPTNVDTNTYLYLEDVIDQPSNPSGFPSSWGVFTGVNGGPAGQPVPADYAMKPAIVNADRPGMVHALESLPTVSIVADPDDLFSSEGILANPFGNVDGSGVHTQTPFVADRRCSMEWFQPDGALEDQIDCGVRLVGGWSRHYRASPKKSLRLIFRSEFGPTKWSFPLFGEGEIDEFDKVQMRATFSDGWVDNARPAQFLRDPFLREVYLGMGQPGSRGTFVHLYLNGLYWGIYNPTERPDGDYGASHYGGPDADYDAVKHEGLRGPGQAATNAYEVIDGTAARWQEALNIAAGNMADTATYTQFRQYVDVVSLADYFLLNSYLANTDWPGKNWYAFGRRDGADGGFKFSPWDSEYALHELNGNRVNVSGTVTPARFYDRARANPEFRLLFADRVHRHAFNGGPLSASSMVARYTAMAAHIEPAIDAEAARWGDNPNTRMGVRDYRKSHWLSARNTVLNSFLPNRHPIAIAQYRAAGLYPSIDAPEFSQHGGLLDPPAFTFANAPPGTIYYTTDGSDPRLEGGAVHPNAIGLQGGSFTQTFVDFEESGWHYLVTGTSEGDSEIVHGHPGYGPAHWKHPDFDDSPWATGQALLGFGTIDNTTINTTIGFGGNIFDKNRTTYFRKDFHVADASMVSELFVNMIRDDGAIVYVNGREIGRTNMSSGNQTYGAFASSDANPEDEIVALSYAVPQGMLANGTNNVLAVEVHQVTAGSSDLGIDAQVRGAISNNGITLAQSGTVKARALSPGGEWSALTEAFFTINAVPASALNTLVSKIHYRPAAPSQAEIDAGFDTRGDFEYFELYNFGSETVSLAGVVVSGALDFAFPANAVAELAPGERGVVVANTAAFQMRYGDGPRILGEFQSGQLNDDGEEIVVLADGGAEMWRFTYNDAGAWPNSPDGDGPALVLVDPDDPPANADLSLPENWRPSATDGGAPGSDDRTFLADWLATRPDPDPLADPDGDGVSQLMAFVTGALDGPHASAFLPSIVLEAVDVGGVVETYPIVSVRRLTGGAGVAVAVLQSTDLSPWASAGLVLLASIDNGDGTHTLRFRPEFPYDPNVANRQFFRLSATASP